MAEDSEPNYLMGFLFTLVAGLSTALGVGFIPLVNSGLVTKEKGLAASLGFAGGVMMWLSFMGIMGREAAEFFEKAFDHGHSHDEASHQHEHAEDGVPIRLAIFGFFFLGLILTAVLEMFVDTCFGHGHGHSHGGGAREVQMGEHHDHAGHNHDEIKPPQAEHGGSKLLETKATSAVFADEDEKAHRDQNLMKVSVMAMLALALHNFPEGLAIFFSSAKGDWMVLVGIILHNIPGGAAVSIPIHRVTGSYAKAISGAVFAGIAQPLGAAFGWLLITVFDAGTPTDYVYGAIYSATAGTMVAISLAGMLPEALATASNFFVLMSVAVGFLFMEATIIISDLTGGHSH